MNKTIKNLGTVVIVVAVISLLMGLGFVWQGFSKQAFLTDAMKAEKITLGSDAKDPQVVLSMDQAQKAADTIREHRHKIAPTYGDLLGPKQFDPTNPKQLTYAQAMNLENYLYLAVASFGLVLVVLGSGAYMILSGIALGAVGMALKAIAAKLT
jgi:hypothetical protein